MKLPPCPNFLEGSCPQSEVFVGKETDSAFILACRTCGGKNIWPKDRDDNAARYQTFLKKQADMEARRRAIERAPAYNFDNVGRKS